MDPILAMRLSESSRNFDSSLYRTLSKLAQDYRTAGTNALDYFVPDMDAANDIVNCFTPQLRQDFERDRMSVENFRHPMGATEITTLTTFVSQILFGGETTRRVEPRNPDDEAKADVINELLAWNDNQQQTYNQGYHWIWDAVTFNRGVMYDHWQEMCEVVLEPVEEEIPFNEPTKDENNRTIRKPKNYTPGKSTRYRKIRRPIGGFVKMENISPYDFICDPTIPLSRFQEGRFAGHRVVLTWQELERRSKLDPDHYQYVLPDVVKKLKNGKGKPAALSRSGTSASIMSRTAYERTRRAAPVSTVTGTNKINKEDGGIVECWCIQIRAAPSTYGIFPDDDEPELIEVLIGSENDLLSVNIMTNKHDQYPYSVGEARPNAHMQFGPSTVLILKGCQDFVDYMCRRRRESLARTSGNIFVGNPAYVDFDAFLDPRKDGLFIPITEEGAGKPLDQVVKQIPVVDTTARFHEEAMAWVKTSEDASGAHAATQGQTDNPSQTATQYSGNAQMASGRISTIARLLSAGALMDQTRRIVGNLQQFLPDTVVIRVVGDKDDFDPDKPAEKFMRVIRDKSALPDGSTADEDGNAIPRDPLLDSQVPDIQGNFDIVVSDGSLPGTDAKKVAALTRVVEVASSNPELSALIFDDTVPGNISLKRTFYKLIKQSGFPIGGLAITRKEAMDNAQKKMAATGMGVGMPAPSPTDPAAPGPEGIPDASQLPPIPSAEPVQIRPENA